MGVPFCVCGAAQLAQSARNPGVVCVLLPLRRVARALEAAAVPAAARERRRGGACAGGTRARNSERTVSERGSKQAPCTTTTQIIHVCHYPVK